MRPIWASLREFGAPLKSFWSPPELGGPVTLLRVLPPVIGPELTSELKKPQISQKFQFCKTKVSLISLAIDDMV